MWLKFVGLKSAEAFSGGKHDGWPSQIVTLKLFAQCDYGDGSLEG